MSSDPPGSPRPLPGLSELRSLLDGEGASPAEPTASAAPPSVDDAALPQADPPADPPVVSLEAPQEWVDRREDTAEAPRPTLRERLGRLFGRGG